MIPSGLAGLALLAARPEVYGRVRRMVGLRLEIVGLSAAIGDFVAVSLGSSEMLAEVVAFDDEALVCLPLGHPKGITRDLLARVLPGGLSMAVGDELRGRVLDGLGRPLDGRPLPVGLDRVGLTMAPPPPLSRQAVTEPLPLGVKVLDTLLSCGRGQRLGIFAGSGVGKSTLLSMLTRGTKADVSVIALVGERGREAEEFVHSQLGPEGLERSVVVIATSDQPALVRLTAARTATRIAEWFRDDGHDVLLLMDSLTRFAMAQREVGLAAGEPPTTRGYPPSTFSALAGLLERAGQAERGSITGLYTVLVEGDDLDEPVSDAARSILDGHVVLSRSLAARGHFPSVDVLASVSRLAPVIQDHHEREVATKARRLLALYEENRDLIEVGAYHKGASPEVDQAIERRQALNGALSQASSVVTTPAEAWAELEEAVGQ